MEKYYFVELRAHSFSKTYLVSRCELHVALVFFNSCHRRAHCYCHNVSYIPGNANSMAEASLRTQHLSDPELLALFEQRYPQEKPWQLVHLPTAMTLSLTSSLLCRPQTSLTPGEPSPIKITSLAVGFNSAPPMASRNPSATSRIPTKRSA